VGKKIEQHKIKELFPGHSHEKTEIANENIEHSSAKEYRRRATGKSPIQGLYPIYFFFFFPFLPFFSPVRISAHIPKPQAHDYGRDCLASSGGEGCGGACAHACQCESSSTSPNLWSLATSNMNLTCGTARQRGNTPSSLLYYAHCCRFGGACGKSVWKGQE
jgi:hypothetical protein